MTIYSHSRISTYEQCPLKFKFQYIDKLRPAVEEYIEGFLGNKVHETLEWVYKNVLSSFTPSLDEAIEYFLCSWDRDFNNNIKIVNEELDTKHFLNKGIRFLIDYFNSNHPFKDNTIAIEQKILVSLDSEGRYLLQGYIDRLVHNKDTNIFEIHDYKTGNFIKTQEELDNDRQLALYSLGIRELFENVREVNLIWHFLSFDKKMMSNRTEEQLEKLKQETINLIKKIESEKEFLPNPGKLCKWCGFRAYCPLFAGLANLSE